jgi:hypothetical protein
MNLDLPELDRIEAKLDKLLSEDTSRNSIPEWSSLKTAWSAKGGCAYETMRSQRRLQPMGGKPDAYIGGVAVYSKETILEWLDITDAMLDDYHRKHETGCISVKRASRRRGSALQKELAAISAEATA